MGGGAPPISNPSVAEATRLASLRRSTPDSEALMSSDDEHDLSKSVQSLTGKPTRQSTMEGSWLNEIQSGPPRRPSATTTTSNMSQPPTPSEQAQDHNGWPFQNPLGRVSSHPVTASWNSGGPWGAQPRMLGEDRPQFSNTGRDGTAPYAISLQPVPKTHRSQSYSVGQMESELSAAAAQGSSLDQQRRTPSQQLPHRPSKPSMLSEVFGGHGTGLGQDRYDPEQFGLRSATSPISPDGRRENVVESSHNPLLRHATKARARHGQSASTSDTRSPTGFHSAYHHAPALPASEEVIDEEPEQYTAAGLTRRFSELTGLGGPSEGSRRGQWQTTLGFGTLPDIPQSRRHSMAEMPTRRNSLVGNFDQPDPFSPIDNENSLGQHTDPFHSSVMNDSHQRDMQNRNYAQSYFSGVGPALRSRIESSQSPISPGLHGLPYQTSPQGLFNRPSQDTLLYLVSFKCARAEVYYVADNTGLEVKEGDLVIVEADRGHDLGTVLYAKVSWDQARALKHKANDEHYRWLMMFSRHNQASEGTVTGGTGGMMAGSAPERSPNQVPSGAAVFNPSMIDKSRETELKPKMVKRLAQPHEIATLRDKEGNEAKAKRICSQKVNEMKLDMEILDAEFQTDWKKLTFFYYANSYVNFNALVTDLFKIYKTRIWMSAVNPASLNTGPLPPPRGLGPGVVSGHDSVMSHRSGGSRGYSSGSYGGEQYNPNSMYERNANAGNGYSYGEEHGSSGRSHSNTPAQQACDMMSSYNSNHGQQQMGGQNYNAPMQSYGWAGYSGAYGGYNPGQMSFASGLGMPHTRGTPHDQAGGYGLPSRVSMSPISPPGTQSQRGR
ncbi:hypothetical protein B9Z65_3850 [Elsinoe australis]|uniref:PSP1 C-terminal domain-containing protein n=1 Tax=Elsinoe australis TaxID=40998 RepID=A0A2P8A2Q5_9PEZI|nr:hypothetical protein B9Z65_3850 [Elsinoe australis]